MIIAANTLIILANYTECQKSMNKSLELASNCFNHFYKFEWRFKQFKTVRIPFKHWPGLNLSLKLHSKLIESAFISHLTLSWSPPILFFWLRATKMGRLGRAKPFSPKLFSSTCLCARPQKNSAEKQSKRSTWGFILALCRLARSGPCGPIFRESVNRILLTIQNFIQKILNVH